MAHLERNDLMQVLAGLIVYKRMHNVQLWTAAWHNAVKDNAKLIVVHNHDGSRPLERDVLSIEQCRPDVYYPRPNVGQDIGAFKDVINDPRLDPWDILFWATDDNIPVSKHFLSAFTQPFKDNTNLGLVGNYWVDAKFYRRRVPAHFRTSCFAISRGAAKKLKFNRLRSKSDCYKFEWSGSDNMTNQIRNMGFDLMPVCGDWSRSWTDSNQFIWDIGALHMRTRDPRCRRNYWKQYKAQFE